MSPFGTSRHFAGLQNWVAIRAERTWPQLAPSSTRSRMNPSQKLLSFLLQHEGGFSPYQSTRLSRYNAVSKGQEQL